MKSKAKLSLFCAATMLVACSQSGPGPVTPLADACLLLEPPDSARDSVTVALAEPVDLSHAPAPATEAERLVFGTFYETVTRLDCGGNVRPGLAKAWGMDLGAQHWRFTLRSDVKFSDGWRLTAEDVVASLAARLAPRDSIAVGVDSFTFNITLARPDSDLPHRLADPTLAIARAPAAGGVGAPLGTAPYRVSEWTPGRIAGVPMSGALRDIVFRLSPSTDARDLLDQGADVVFTDNPAALEYARSRDTYVVAPLEWSWVYAFVGPVLPEGRAFRDQMAGGAVRGDVRPATPPFWWADLPPCPRALPTGSSNTAQRRIAYVESDPVARDLVERLVALAASGQALAGGEVRALPLSGAEFDLSLATHREYGFVAALPRRQYARCSALPLGAVTPLLDARSEIVIRRGAAGLAINWDGTPRLLIRQ